MIPQSLGKNGDFAYRWFMLYDENEMKMGTSLVFDLDKAPEHLSLRVKGAYRNKHR